MAIQKLIKLLPLSLQCVIAGGDFVKPKDRLRVKPAMTNHDRLRIRDEVPVRNDAAFGGNGKTPNLRSKFCPFFKGAKGGQSPLRLRIKPAMTPLRLSPKQFTLSTITPILLFFLSCKKL
jgi:hypothetical protein